VLDLCHWLWPLFDISQNKDNKALIVDFVGCQLYDFSQGECSGYEVVGISGQPWLHMYHIIKRCVLTPFTPLFLHSRTELVLTDYGASRYRLLPHLWD